MFLSYGRRHRTGWLIAEFRLVLSLEDNNKVYEFRLVLSLEDNKVYEFTLVLSSEDNNNVYEFRLVKITTRCVNSD